MEVLQNPNLTMFPNPRPTRRQFLQILIWYEARCFQILIWCDARCFKTL